MRHEERIDPFLDYIREEWHKNSDQRFGQLLINMGFIEDSLSSWNIEERDRPIPHEFMRKIQHWGTYGKNGDQERKNIPICELSDNHIKNILKTQDGMDKSVREILLNEQNYRIYKNKELLK